MKRTDYISFFSRAVLCLLFCILFGNVNAQLTPQDPTEPPPVIEQQLENLTQSSDDATTEDDSYLQDLVQFIKDPINLN
ncbi:MAG: hypothetical protein ACRDE5_18075, partial [Ginsengibacter sp.]